MVEQPQQLFTDRFLVFD